MGVLVSWGVFLALALFFFPALGLLFSNKLVVSILIVLFFIHLASDMAKNL